MQAFSLRFVALVAAGLGLVSGCATQPRARVHSVAVAVTTVDGKAPSADQVAHILAALGPEIARAGFQLSPIAAEADFVVTVKFAQAPEGTGGQVLIAGMEPHERFKKAPGMGESEELRDIRRRIREMDAWSSREMTRTDQ